MRPPCELVVNKILPTIRAEIVKLLAKKYKMKQEDIAEILGIAQSSVSLYVIGMRGGDEKLLSLFPEVQKYIESTAEKIYNKELDRGLITFCKTCMELRSKREFCEYHQEFSQLLKCNICFTEH